MSGILGNVDGEDRRYRRLAGGWETPWSVLLCLVYRAYEWQNWVLLPSVNIAVVIKKQLVLGLILLGDRDYTLRVTQVSYPARYLQQADQSTWK